MLCCAFWLLCAVAACLGFGLLGIVGGFYCVCWRLGAAFGWV